MRLTDKYLLGYTRSRETGKVMNYHRKEIANTMHGSSGGGVIPTNSSKWYMRTDKVIMIGNVLYGSFRHGFAYNVIGQDGVCYTLSTMGGGNRQPMIIEIYDTD